MRGSPYGSQRSASPQFSQARMNADLQHIECCRASSATTILGLSWTELCKNRGKHCNLDRCRGDREPGSMQAS